MSKPFVPVMMVGEAIAGEAASTKKQLENLINSVEKSNLDIGELLYKTKVKAFYTDWGFSTWQEYISSLNIKARRAQYLARIVGVMDVVGVLRTDYEPLGISRLREITSLDPSVDYVNPITKNETPMVEFIKGLVKKDEETNDYIPLDKIRQHVRVLKGFVGDADMVCEHLWMTRGARDNTWIPAIELAKANIGSVAKDDEGISQDASNGAAAEKLAIEYLNDPSNKFADLLGEAEEENEENNEA